MKKILLCAALFYTHFASGQFVDKYRFEVENNKTYTPLHTGVNLTEGILWFRENFKIPLGFISKVGDKTITDFSIVNLGIFGPVSDTSGEVSAFVPSASVLTDRSFYGDPPQSPIRYTVEGIVPNRIFKLEYFNAGFYDELFSFGTNNDFVSFQVWLYETTDMVEFHYGPSRITHPFEYFQGNAPIIGYIRNIDLVSFDLEGLYYLLGNPTNPFIDSVSSEGMLKGSMDAHPDSGTVYRFIPKPMVGFVEMVDITKDFRVYPTQVHDVLLIEYQSSGRASAQVLDISGRTVQPPVPLLQGTNRLDMGALPRGQYFVRFMTAAGNAVYRFTKL